MTANAAASTDDIERLVKGSGSSFYWAMRLLPLEKRRAMYAVYAFCREVDDIADEPGEEADKRQRLSQWREEIARVFAGEPQSSLGRAIEPVAHRYELKQADFLAVIEGMEMDAGGQVRIRDMATLETYCDRVACAVGRLSNPIFGVPGESGDRLAGALGHALQLTNILRDITEDAHIDRIYLPQDLLAKHGIDEAADALTVTHHPGLAAVCAELVPVIEERFAEARALIADCDRRATRPARMMMEVYGRTFERLKKRGWRNPYDSVRLSKLEKLWIALRYGLL